MISIGRVLFLKEYRQNLKFKKVCMFNNHHKNQDKPLEPVRGDKVSYLLQRVGYFHPEKIAQ